MVFEVRRRSSALLGSTTGSSDGSGAGSTAAEADNGGVATTSGTSEGSDRSEALDTSETSDRSEALDTNEGSLPDGGMTVRRSVSGARWRFETDGQVRGSPVVDGDTLYAGSNDGTLYAIDRTSGEERWRLETGARRVHAPVVVDDTVYAASDEALYALDASTGTERWRFQARIILTPPVVADGTVFTYANRPGKWRLHALDATDGTFRWTVREDADDIDRLQTNLIVADGTCYVGTWEVIYSFAIDSGRVRWSRERPQIVESLAAVDGELLCGGRTGDESANLYALDAIHGTAGWTATTRPGEWVTAVRVVGDTLLASSIEPHHDGTKTTRLHARSIADGAARWSVVTNRETTTSVPPRPAAVADGVVFIPGGHQLYALDADDGTERARFVADGEIHTSAASADGAVYVGSDDGSVYAFDLPE